MFSAIFDKALPDAHLLLEYVVNHVFFPIYHPEKDDYTPENAHTLACAVHTAACAYSEYVDGIDKHQWLHITEFLKNLHVLIGPSQPWQPAIGEEAGIDEVLKSKRLLWDYIISQLDEMKAEDVLVLPTRCHVTTCGVIFRRQDHSTVFEAVASNRAYEREQEVGCSLLGLTVEIPNVVIDNDEFRYKLSGLLCGAREELLTDMLRGVGQVVEQRLQPSLSLNLMDFGFTGLHQADSPRKLDQNHIILQLSGMKAGDVLSFRTPYQDTNSRVVFRKQDHSTLYEALDAIRDLTNKREVARSRTALTIEIPNAVFEDEVFQSNLASFLCGTNEEILVRILRGSGRLVEPRYTTQYPGPHRISVSSQWSRSDLWFLIRVAIKTSFHRSPPGQIAYDTFMLFLMYNLGNHAVDTNLSSLLIHSMSAKLLRRLRNLSSGPQWLHDAVLHTCTSLSQTLDRRWEVLQATQRSFSPWDPSELDLIGDSQAYLPRIHEYISTSLIIYESDSPRILFSPQHCLRGTLDSFLSNPDDFLSDPDNLSSSSDDTFSDFDDCPGKKSQADIRITLYDVERAIAEDIDEWVAGVTDVDEACAQLECLLHRYYSTALDTYGLRGNSDSDSNFDGFRTPTDPDHISIMLLTIIELWVALDKLVIKEIPILADYSPRVPTDLLYRILLRDALNIHRFSRAFQYISARDTQAYPGWSVFSHIFSKHSFPCRYFDGSPHLQHLGARIRDILPVNPFAAKAVVFELRCPASFSTWRSVTSWISGAENQVVAWRHTKEDVRVCDIPALKPHAEVNLAPHSLSLYSSGTAPRDWNTLYYHHQGSPLASFEPVYELRELHSALQRYLDTTIHTSNEILADQANCHHNLSMHEFVAFAHLRAGGSLQWLNILRELRSRTLDFQSQEIYLLLAQASAQVGPLHGGELSWHQELQDPSFCRVLLDELQSLFVDTGVGSLDGPVMATISLLAGVLASRSSGDISEQAIQLLRDVRRKTFSWVRELLCDMWNSPANSQSLELLRDLAAVCRSSFDVDCGALRKPLLHSTQDVEIALSCAMLVCTTGPLSPPSLGTPMYSQVLLNRDRRLSLILEGSLRDAIEADASDTAVDHAVQLVWPGYRPSPCRWKPLKSPSSPWLVCETASTRVADSQMVHVNLLDGSLMVDGRPIGNRLPSVVTSDESYITLFDSRELMVVASDLLGMDFVTMSVISGHYVHFAVREDIHGLSMSRIVICVQNKDTGDIFEYIPQHVMARDLPPSVIAHHVSWLNLSTSIVEIRPIGKLWEHSSDNWMVHLQSGQPRVTRGGEILVDKRSQTWSMISSRLQCLDSPDNCVITVFPIDTVQSPSLQASVTLRRYGLTFFVNEAGDLESTDFKDMVYDEDQSTGTLFGLVNQLVLRPKIEADLFPKLLLIPHGSSIEQHGHSVHVKYDTSGHAEYHTYQVDGELGYLRGISSFSLESRLYLARLHALTSNGWRPDPLTGRTGVEEAASLMWLTGRPSVGECSRRSESQSPQIDFLSTNLSSYHNLPLRHEAYLFPASEVTAAIASGVQFPRTKLFQSLDQLLLERPPPKLRARADRLPRFNSGHHLPPPPEIGRLCQLFSSLRTDRTAPPFQSQYISRLHSSAYHLQATEPTGTARPGCSGKHRVGTLRNRYAQCRINYTESLGMIKEVLSPTTEFERVLEQCGQWPRVTPFILFRLLASTSPTRLSNDWKKCLTSLAILALDLQQARRLLYFALDGFEEEFHKELENDGCDERDLAKYPDWLLIQLQCNFLIRRAQADIAKEMMSPRSGKNAIMQVNMGEGKSSVIIPICAAALADGNQVVRVIVPKALIPQTTRLMIDRLCGLVNKPTYLLTFFRENAAGRVRHRIPGSKFHEPEYLHERILEWRSKRGIIIMQPEAVLSLKLACVENQLLDHGIGTDTIPRIPKPGFEIILHLQMNWLSKSWRKDTYVSSLTGAKQLHRDPMSSQLEDFREALTGSRQVQALMKIQKFLGTHARDILEESDDVLRPQFQLVYATGHQHSFEGSPTRWVLVQQVLGLVKRHTYFLSTPHSRAVQCDSATPGSFPHIHILHSEGGEQLVSLIAQDVLDGRVSGFGLHSELGIREAVREFMLYKDVHPGTVKLVEGYTRQSTSWSSLLLLRGLLAHNLLLSALTQSRWRVDYGLDPSPWPRTMLAIPYRAKDVPTETAEFGHPDVTILLTCLSYYYGGLSEEQLKISFEVLLQEEDPASEYALWLEECTIGSVPDSLRKLSDVNTRSLEQWVKYLVPIFSRSKRVIDLYLSKVVFQKYAKEYPLRIPGSYWDIAERKNCLLTGLSGTSDGQYLLPTSIDQSDPDLLRQTGANARVLAHLLQPENSSYMVTSDKNGQRWTSRTLLRTMVAQDPQIRVLLDVGAQILDLTNHQLAEAWLNCTPVTETTGAIYFNKNDELMVLERNGNTRLLSSSPLVQQLHRCVAYLDDAHTRGTDIKFPLGFRAAITLGPKVTKDRLVQGCMRMRRLGSGHSVMFFASHDVDQRIRGLKMKPSTNITTADILHWTIHETWSDIQRQAPYWAQQGMTHQARYDTWSRFCENRATAEELAEAWVQPESKSLADMYMPCHSQNATSLTNLPRQIRERCENLGVLSLRDIRMDEEQEREVSREIEIEREREVENPHQVSPASHFLHPDVVHFVRTGVVPSPSRSKAFCHVFTTDVSAASSEPHSWSPYILATADFCKTIKESNSVQGEMTRYLRPVQWVVSGKMHGHNALVVMSPFEVEQLMSEIRTSEHVHLHLYIPRTTKRMKPADDLRLYTIPPLPSDWTPPWDLIDQLNIFAGQLYLDDYAAYVRVCRFLGVHAGDLSQNADTVIHRNWLSNPDSTSDTEIRNRLEGTPLPLAMYLLALRRGMDFAGTHMGKILDGWPFAAGDFDGVEQATTIGPGVEPEDHRVPSAAFISAEAGDKRELAQMSRRSVSDDEPTIGRPSKRRRPN